MTVFAVSVQTVPLAVASDFQMPAAATSQDEIEMGNVRELLLVITLAATCPASAQAAAWTHSPADDRIGRIYYYERSNTDGNHLLGEFQITGVERAKKGSKRKSTKRKGVDDEALDEKQIRSAKVAHAKRL